MSTQIVPSQMALLQSKTKLRSANKGHDLTKRKADALKVQFMQVTKKLIELKKDLGNLSKNSFISLAKVNFSTTGDVARILDENVRRTADILHESVEYAMLDYMDFPIDNGLIDSICETVNQFIRTLIGRGALIDGKCTFNEDKNPSTEMANGHLVFDIDFMPPTPAERITFESFIDIELLQSLGNNNVRNG